jgi:hypothetical protein
MKYADEERKKNQMQSNAKEKLKELFVNHRGPVVGLVR